MTPVLGGRGESCGALIAAAVVAAIAFVLAVAAADHTGFNPDESRWMSRAHYLAAVSDPFGPVWTDRYVTRGQPPLGSYAMGAGLLLQGRDLQTNPPWNFSVTWEANIAVGNKPIAGDLAAGRSTSAALTALTVVVLIAVARTFLPLSWATVTGGLYAVHPFTHYIGSLATADALFGLLIALAALAAAGFARQPTWARAALLGTVLGLGGAAKIAPLVLAAALGAGGLLLLAAAVVRQRTLPARETAYAANGLLIGLAAWTTFVAVYPYLWPDPVGRTRHLFAFRAEEMAAQAADWPEMAVPTRAEALRRVGVNFGERFSISSELARWLGRAAPWPVRFLEILTPLAGLLVMTAMAARDGPYSPRALVLAVLGGQAAITILGMRSEFDRYHVPMALLGAVAAAAAGFMLARLFAARVSFVATASHSRRRAGMRSNGRRQTHG